MKRIIVTIVITVFVVCNLHAQSDEEGDSREDLRLGLKAGANISNVYDDRAEEFEADAKLGFAGGAFLRVPIGKYLGVQPEVLWSQKGFEANGQLMGSYYRVTRTTNFLDVPVLVALKPTSFLTILAGPQYSYMLSQRDVFTNETATVAEEQEFENDNIRKNILCFLGGLDFDFDHVVLAARAGWDIQHNNGDGTSTSPRYKNVWYQATIGVKF